ncbi:DUF4468 domain-containing protein [Hymenobacter sp. YC55]|uniref:DUF4468 domain-containing protein n=1 Tax=Hymenobacter sp. YC55 TaxID=3034019 RepID=UPI0023FA2DDB|nr:DUF4468 domain-containing protein [Hymenobacter sp. YC55]MDF7813335.1 DUF4468 domain-containing protein [Hymenobacter sp. YC55]
MKSIIIASWLLLSSVGLYAQTSASPTLPVDTETKRVTYTGVVAVDGVSQNELYTRAKLWLFLTFDEAKDVVKVDEKDAGLLIIRAYTDLPVRSSQSDFEPTNREVGYTMMLNFKDGRYKYTLTNYNLVVEGRTIPIEKEITAQLSKPKDKGVFAAQQYAEKVGIYAKSLAQSLDVTLHKPVSGENDW